MLSSEGNVGGGLNEVHLIAHGIGGNVGVPGVAALRNGVALLADHAAILHLRATGPPQM